MVCRVARSSRDWNHSAVGGDGRVPTSVSVAVATAVGHATIDI